jgi:hypothetical protein
MRFYTDDLESMENSIGLVHIPTKANLEMQAKKTPIIRNMLARSELLDIRVG